MCIRDRHPSITPPLIAANEPTLLFWLLFAIPNPPLPLLNADKKQSPVAKEDDTPVSSIQIATGLTFPFRKSPQGFASPPHDGFAKYSLLLKPVYHRLLLLSSTFFLFLKEFTKQPFFSKLSESFLLIFITISWRVCAKTSRTPRLTRGILGAFYSGATSSASRIISPKEFCRSSAVVSSPVRI